jgi:predicted O-methyltransferase YrrM
MIGQMPHGIDFVLLDLWKDLLVDCLDAFYPKLNSGAIIVADNMIFPAAAAADALRYRQAVRARPKMSSLLVPVGSGLEISRFDCQV